MSSVGPVAASPLSHSDGARPPCPIRGTGDTMSWFVPPATLRNWLFSIRDVRYILNAVRTTDEVRTGHLTFVEDVAVAFEQGGLPRMAGRVIGWLLICDPPEQSSAQLAEVLRASKGSISTSTRLLVSSGLVERRSQPGQRRDYFRIQPQAWAELVRLRLDQVTSFRQLTQRGLALLHPCPPARRTRLEDVNELYTWLESELPALWERWRQRPQG